MLLFIDTEFTDLYPPYLVPAAMVTMGRRDLYFEIAEGSRAVSCALTRKTELPLLDGPALNLILVSTRTTDS
jgi:hypothetical protein